jgi:hypothetical protein
LPEIFQSTWGITPEPFWPKATAAVHAGYSDFTFMAEVYWDLEWTSIIERNHPGDFFPYLITHVEVQIYGGDLTWITPPRSR